MTKSNPAGRDFLVLWKWHEAQAICGTPVTGGWGRHSGGLRRGDRTFVWATNKNELYLLGVIEIERGGHDWSKGRRVYGQFQIIPLKSLKWRLRFQQSASDRLSPKASLAMQVRARRRPTPETVRLLERILQRKIESTEQDIRVREGTLKVMTVSKRERDPNVRLRALARRGDRCEICRFSFAERYGDFARYCLEVHHLKPVSSARKRGSVTVLDDVLVV